jgi:uncharacterized protein (TIGR02598 family)
MKNRTISSPAGFSLIEVTLALGIAAFCLLSVFGLLPLGLSNTQSAAEQTAVSGIATAISADLHSVSTISSSGTSTSMFNINIPSPTTLGPGSSAPQTVLFFTSDGSTTSASSSNGTPHYRATIQIRPDGNLANINGKTTLLKAWVFITWPALADLNNTSSMPSNFQGSYEFITSLNYFSN